MLLIFRVWFASALGQSLWRDYNPGCIIIYGQQGKGGLPEGRAGLSRLFSLTMLS